MKIAYFHNFTTEDFTGYWNGKGKVFKPGIRVPMEEWRARHFAKHLANRELLTSGRPQDENYTSPKRPEDVPRFMELFNKACIIEGEDTEEEDEEKEVIGEISSNIDPQPQAQKADKEVQIAEFPDDGEDESEK